jgi:DNA-binding transcriptional regulator LsrR (DeoR family)
MSEKHDKHIDSEQLDLATRAAWLSYIGGYTQGEVAKRLQVSPVKAHRLIQQAHQLGMVKIFIEGSAGNCAAMEDTLIEQFGLQSCLIVPLAEDAHDNELRGFNEVGSGSAGVFHKLLKKLPNGSRIGIGKGRSLIAMAERLPSIARSDLVFASVSGSFTRKFSANRLDVVHALVERTGGEGYFMPMPYIAKDDQERDMLMAQPSVQDSLQLAREADLYVIGIGALKNNHYLNSVGLVGDEDLEELRHAGAVCDLLGSFYDLQGKPVDSPINHHALGISASDVEGKRVMAVAAGLGKEYAILAALRSQLLTDLVMDEATAQALLAIKEA